MAPLLVLLLILWLSWTNTYNVIKLKFLEQGHHCCLWCLQVRSLNQQVLCNEGNVSWIITPLLLLLVVESVYNNIYYNYMVVHILFRTTDIWSASLYLSVLVDWALLWLLPRCSHCVIWHGDVLILLNPSMMMCQRKVQAGYLV